MTVLFLFKTMNKNETGIRGIIVDLIVTIMIIAAVVFNSQWLTYLVIGYTGLMLAVKILVIISEQLRAITKKNKSNAPDLIYHILYGINIAALTVFSWYLTAAAWTIIWILSIYSSRK